MEIGTRVAAYEVIAKLGEGGMGEVFRARDARLQRDVAIKILPDVFAADRDRLARFEREAQVLASLNHPHIAHVYGLETGTNETGHACHALVMELVEGDDLSHRIDAGPLPPDIALPIARQIADALEAAHERGVIHRDLKPANIKVQADGTVKVLDFGLAKLADQAGESSGPHASRQNSPTVTSPALTRAGMLLGTAAYMSPEQVRGAQVDRRADIWAFGCVLFEMLTSRRAFDAQTVSDTLADVLRKEIDWTVLPADTPQAIRDLLRRCLIRDARSRLRDIGDARLAIDEHLAAPAVSASIWGAKSDPQSASSRVALFVATTAAAVATGLAIWAMTRPARPATPMHLTIELGDGLLARADSELALSSDGTSIVFAGRKGTSGGLQLYLRRVDQLDAQAIPGTEDGENPFFSNDGRAIGFFARGKLHTVPIAGGPVTTLADAGSNRGGSWTPDGSIVFSPSANRGVVLMTVAAGGGKPEPLTTLQANEVTHRWPQVLPGGKAVLYTAHSQTGTYDTATLVVSSLDGARRQVVVTNGYHGRYLSSGHIAYIHKGTLLVVPFDLERLAVTGPAVPLAEDVTSHPTSALALFAFADTGALVYSRGAAPTSDATISWIDEQGREQSMRRTPGDYNGLRFSPDGRQLFMDIGANWGEAAIWSYDWARETMTRLTVPGGGEDIFSVPSPDGKRLVFAGLRDGGVVNNIYWQNADGSGRAERLLASETEQSPWSWHPAGRLIAYQTYNFDDPHSDIGLLPVESDLTTGLKAGKSSLILSSPSFEGLPTFSSDGKWLAYTSNESGTWEVYVRSFPGLEGRTKISADGGVMSVWSPVRSELFYISPDGGIWVTSYRTQGSAFVADKARQWAPAGTVMARGRSMDLHPDGKRFAILRGTPPPERSHMTLIADAFGDVRRVLQATK